MYAYMIFDLNGQRKIFYDILAYRRDTNSELLVVHKLYLGPLQDFFKRRKN